MKRHDALVPLSHDHHHALAQARKLLKAASSDDLAEHISQAREFIDFYSKETVQHFREEEKLIFPLMLEYLEEIPTPLPRLLMDHVKVHSMVGRLQRQIDEGTIDATLLRDIGELLRSHIRMEEQQIFPIIEKAVDEKVLRSVVLSSRVR